MSNEFKSPQQQIFDTVFLSSLRLGYRTVDYLPSRDFNLPFVFIGEQFDQDLRTKTNLYGSVQQTIHVFHERQNRRDLTTMMNNIKKELRNLKLTENFYLSCKNITSQTLIDADSGLLHGIIEVEIIFH